MSNIFVRMQEENEQRVPPELERHLLTQVNHINVFGRVVELFVPNALQTAARIIGGSPEDGPVDMGGDRNALSPDDWPDWRFPPGRSVR